ncbi:MAG: hypothetical protein JRN29_05900 [Nitrososphaerota archaeon]|nr:hypothetical protein [Nitrososphaerota archaeon]
MGGTKKKTLASMEKEQDKPTEDEKKKEQKRPVRRNTPISRLGMDTKPEEALPALKGLKAITVYGAAKALSIRGGVASTILRDLEAKGQLTMVGGFSGHYIYRLSK